VQQLLIAKIAVFMQLLLISAIKDNKTAQKFVRLRRIGMKFLDCFFIFIIC